MPGCTGCSVSTVAGRAQDSRQDPWGPDCEHCTYPFHAVCLLECHRPPTCWCFVLRLWAVVTATGLAPLTTVGLNYGGAGVLYSVNGVVLLVGFVRVASGLTKICIMRLNTSTGQGRFRNGRFKERGRHLGLQQLHLVTGLDFHELSANWCFVFEIDIFVPDVVYSALSAVTCISSCSPWVVLTTRCWRSLMCQGIGRLSG